MDGVRDRPNLWTRLTGAVNVLVWRLPLPRRVASLLSLVVYRNPAISASWALLTLATLDPAGIEWVLVGGWAADAVAGKQLRPHRDLDLLIDERDLDRARSALAELGYEPWHSSSSPGPIGAVEISWAEALRDPAKRVVELHCADLDRLERSVGSVGGQPVTCLSAEEQLQGQLMISGRAWTPAQRRRRRLNIEALERAKAAERRAGSDDPRP